MNQAIRSHETGDPDVVKFEDVLGRRDRAGPEPEASVTAGGEPRGALRAMIKRHAAGDLALGASVHGIWQREGASHTREQATQ